MIEGRDTKYPNVHPLKQVPGGQYARWHSVYNISSQMRALSIVHQARARDACICIQAFFLSQIEDNTNTVKYMLFVSAKCSPLGGLAVDYGPPQNA